MEVVDAIDIGKEAIWVLLKISAPILIVSLVVGLIISLFQALTQIQESTLTFVPKMFAVFITIIISLPFMFETLKDFQEDLADRITREHDASQDNKEQ
jgi:flagellar biosynthetic protein FliQ